MIGVSGSCWPSGANDTNHPEVAPSFAGSSTHAVRCSVPESPGDAVGAGTARA